jgi:ABC-type microcin C transport system permease subunit YejE
VTNITVLVILFITLLISGIHAYVETKLAEKHGDSYLPKDYVYIESDIVEEIATNETIEDSSKNGEN